MESKWGYQMTQKADADLDDVVGYTAFLSINLIITVTEKMSEKNAKHGF